MTISFFYLFEVSVLLAVTQVVYRLFLQRLTFYQANRFVLVGSLLFSCLAPLLSFPVEQSSLSTLSTLPSVPLLVNPTAASLPSLPAAPSLLADSLKASLYLYCGGVIFFFLQLLLKIGSLLRLVNRAQKQKHAFYTLLLDPTIEAPFSFYKYIGLNKDRYPDDTFTHILQHEQVHLQHGHSLDLLLIELYLIFFWFSPFAWWHRKLMILNLEFLADQAVLEGGIPSENYQLSLLSMSLNKTMYPLTNPFTQSSMKARIRMINQAPSFARSRMKYLWLLVTGVAILFMGSLSKARHTESLSKDWKAESNLSQSPLKQSRVLKGIVKTAESGKPIRDVQVIVVGTSKKTTTDAEGRFSIDVSEQDQIIEFIPMDFTSIKADNYYPPLAMQITASQEMIVLLTRYPLSRLKDTTIYFMDGRRISEQEYEKQKAKGFFPTEFLGSPGLKKINLINRGNID